MSNLQPISEVLPTRHSGLSPVTFIVEEQAVKAFKQYRDLNLIVDEVFERVMDFNWSNKTLADKAGLGAATVNNLVSRRTKYPRLQTVYLLIKAVGGNIRLVMPRTYAQRVG